jgi:hypothetical protein
MLLFLILIEWLGVDLQIISEADDAAATLLRVLDYERKKRDGKEDERDELSGTVEPLLSALAECKPTDEDKLSFLESGLQRLVSRRRESDSSLHAIALRLLDKFAGER